MNNNYPTIKFKKEKKHENVHYTSNVNYNVRTNQWQKDRNEAYIKNIADTRKNNYF